ncbi:MAG: flagellar assembly protein FliW [Pseudonocardiales bacterium]|jgi:flagellar assembly factor FliW|nr:flagellar assembly protein FliW [Pseudonocardiales bacterium]
MTTMTDTALQITFVEPLPGFADEDEYTLTAIDSRGVLFSLRSMRDPNLRFVLTPAAAFFDDYRPDITSVLAGVLGSEDVELMLVLTITSGLADATANLRAPIAMSAQTGRAVQVVLDDESLPMRQLLPRH